MTNSERIKERLSGMMFADRGSGSERILHVIKSDLYVLLRDYMSLKSEDLSVVIQPVEGGYQLLIRAETERLLDSGKTLQ